MMGQRAVHILDDDLPFRESLAFMLSAHGFDCALHDDARALVSRFGATDSANLICDIRMPEMNGIEVARHLARTAPDVRVILVTGHADPGLINEGLRAGATAVLEKPVSARRLIDVLLAGSPG